MIINKNKSVNDHDKIPNQWRVDIESYPKPLVTYVKPTAGALPFRVELLPNTMSPDEVARVMRLVVHMARLLPRYAFPAGLDIVDKFAKVPAWMSRQVSQTLAVQVMKRALETENAAVISMARRFLSGNSRDWLFRPKA